MNDQHASLVLGYHGCDRAVGERILAGDSIAPSAKSYDWLGPGAYFWENDSERAMHWARERVSQGKASSPFVVGAVIRLGNCLDLTQKKNLELLTVAYNSLVSMSQTSGKSLPENKKSINESGDDKLLRFLDCAVITRLHQIVHTVSGIKSFDSVRGLFVEGDPVYPGAKFHTLTHTQLAVRNPECVVGTFRVKI